MQITEKQNCFIPCCVTRKNAKGILMLHMGENVSGKSTLTEKCLQNTKKVRYNKKAM